MREHEPHQPASRMSNAHRSNLHVRALLEDTLLAVLGTLAERDAAVPKTSGNATRPGLCRKRTLQRAMAGLGSRGGVGGVWRSWCSGPRARAGLLL
jgi:hypothetical protein